MDVEEEEATGVWGVLRADDGGLPIKEIIIVDRAAARVRWRVFLEVLQLLLDATKRHLFLYVAFFFGRVRKAEQVGRGVCPTLEKQRHQAE